MFLKLFTVSLISTVIHTNEILQNENYQAENTPANYDLNSITPIEIEAVGRVAQLGELYDARSDKFLHLSLFESQLTNVSSTQNSETKLHYTLVNTFEEKFRTLDISAELSVSILGGMIDLKGSGAFFKDTKTSARSAKASLIESFSTTYDDISISNKEYQKKINLDVLGQIDCTHVVVGIQWGGHVFVSVEDTNYDNKDQETVQGNLGAKIKMMYVTVNGNAHVNISQKDINEMSKFNFDVYGDIIPDTMPTTIMDALKFMREVPSLLKKSNNGKGKAMKYVLIPIIPIRKMMKIQAQINQVVTKISETTIKDCVRLFDDINNMAQKLNDLVNDVKRYAQYLDYNLVQNITNLAYSYDVYQLDVKRNLSDALILVRSGNQTMTKIQSMLLTAYESEYSTKKMDIRLKQFDKLKQAFSFYKMMISMNVQLLSKNTLVENFFYENYGKDIYVLFYSNDNSWISDPAMSFFMRIIRDQAHFGKNTIFSAISVDVLDDKLKQDFSLKDIKTKINLYSKNKLVIEHYELGNKRNNQTEPDIWSLDYIRQRILSLTQQQTNENNQLANLLKNPVPIGYIYVQYPGQNEPAKIWPGLNWKDISAAFAGNFFRVVGGAAGPFGAVQGQSVPMLTQVESKTNPHSNEGGKHVNLAQNSWSDYIFSGTDGGGGTHYWFRLFTAGAEVRPTNQAVRVWQRAG